MHKNEPSGNDTTAVILTKIAHYLPSQSPLKDFIHHNTLHAFQGMPFHQSLDTAAATFGYRTRLSLSSYRNEYHIGSISLERLVQIALETDPKPGETQWLHWLLDQQWDEDYSPSVGRVRAMMKEHYHLNPDKEVHPLLFRTLGSFLDQGVGIREFPFDGLPFLEALRGIESQRIASLFRTAAARELLLTGATTESLLDRLVGDTTWHEAYLFDQQFAHPGWSGMVAQIEQHPGQLFRERKISLADLVHFELLLEMDALFARYGDLWQPLSALEKTTPPAIPAETPNGRLEQVRAIWQEAAEWQYYDSVLSGLQQAPVPRKKMKNRASFDALFCIDDRECSLRRWTEKADPNCHTWGTPGFFQVPFMYRPVGSNYFTKACPAPMQPKHLIEAVNGKNTHRSDAHYTNRSHSLVFGWLIAQTLGFWSAFRLFLNLFRPALSPATSHSFRHMDKDAGLQIRSIDITPGTDGLLRGFTPEEMAASTESLLRSIGLVEGHAPLVYVVGHGASSINNTHYAGYDCGACSGRPGSVNARVAAWMANQPDVRRRLAEKGIHIPADTHFVGALHDTTRDEIEYYDEEGIPVALQDSHHNNKAAFLQALEHNACERARRFDLIHSHAAPSKVHARVKRRSVSLFEPRPELNHASNALCLVGRRDMSRHLFLDRRAFMNSYDPEPDTDGSILRNILQALTPVAGGINLEYYFSRTDNQLLGAGSKLPHNVMGLLGVANGADGDLRTGLPAQMTEMHQPLRLLVVVEQTPAIVESVLLTHPPTLEWYRNNWIHLVSCDPITRSLYRYTESGFEPYNPVAAPLPVMQGVEQVFRAGNGDLPVMLIANAS
jgi:hypothetical protein